MLKSLEFLKNPFLFIINLLIYVGLVVLYPFEFSIGFLSKLYFRLKKFSKTVTKKAKSLKFKDLSIYSKTNGIVRNFKDLKSKLKKTSTKSKKKVLIDKKGKDFLIKIRLGKEVKYFVFGIIVSAIVFFVPMQVFAWYKELPQPDLLELKNNKSTKILDRNGRLLYEIYVDRKYNPVELSALPDYLIWATLAIEDDEFYNHFGIRPLSIIRAAKTSVLDNQLQGGSTITQQLVKNVLLSPERTVSRKTKEIVLAILTEQKYSKDEILQMYFNNISYGGTAWGVQAASEKYFGKDVSELTLAESSFLAGLPSAPSIYSPFSSSVSLWKDRQRVVLERMVEEGFITEKEAELAFNEQLIFVPQTEYIRAPHFVNYVKDELYKTYGRRMVDFGGLTVITTLDIDIQENVQRIVKEEVESSSYLNISNGAAVVLDSASGEILAYVGSVDFFEPNFGAFDVVTAYRQPGSSVKPITYALALENNYTVASVIDDTPTTFSFYGQIYTPVNYDGQFHGKVTIRTALANSYNIPAVKLVNELGVDRMVELGNKMGLKNWNYDNTYGLSTTLGGKEVRLLDLTNVFATLSRYGVYKDTTPIISVKDSNGFDITLSNSNEYIALSENVAYLITDILSDNNARAPSFGHNSFLNIPGYQVAVKTGTTDEKRDNLTVGYSPNYTVGVWVGNNNNAKMNPLLSSGLSGAAPIWNKIMTLVLNNEKEKSFKVPSAIKVKTFEECDNRSEIFVEGTIPNTICDKKLHEKENRR